MITTFNIDGMHCTSCKVLIEDACADVPGVIACQVDVDAGIAVIEHDADRAALARAIQALGYQAQEVV
ncbi:heavy metal transporter [Candidatus Uhrbacteria bacterium]|nr:MAG: heavy metal transporter [Candidatus Uhrbacteria bacterium]